MIKINLPPEVESRLAYEANCQGVALADYAGRLIAERLPERASSATEEMPPRGVLPVPIDRKPVSFGKAVVLAKDMPRWQPQASLNRHTVDEGEDV